MFICTAFKSHTVWSDAKCVIAVTTMLLPIIVVTFYCRTSNKQDEVTKMPRAPLTFLYKEELLAPDDKLSPSGEG